MKPAQNRSDKQCTRKCSTRFAHPHAPHSDSWWLRTCWFTLLLEAPPVGIIGLLSRWGFPGGLAGKVSTCNAGDLGSIPGLGRSPEDGNGYPLQYSGVENSMDCIVHGVTKSRTRLSDFTFTFTFMPLLAPTFLVL